MIYTGHKLLEFLHRTEVGTPLRIVLSYGLDWEQSVYGGYKEINGSMYHTLLMNNSLEPRTAISDKFIINNENKVFVDTENNNAEIVTQILSLVGVSQTSTAEKQKTAIKNDWFTEITNNKEMLKHFEYKETYKRIKILKDMRDGKMGLIALALPNNRIILLNNIRSRADAKFIITNKIL